MLTLGQAARTAKRGKTTIQKALKNGTLSGTRDPSGRWLIDPAELHRAFPFKATQIGPGTGSGSTQNRSETASQIDPEPAQDRPDPRDAQIAWLTAALDRERELNDELRADLRAEREHVMGLLTPPKRQGWWPWKRSQRSFHASRPT
jgi:hypothetical protein